MAARKLSESEPQYQGGAFHGRLWLRRSVVLAAETESLICSSVVEELTIAASVEIKKSETASPGRFSERL